MLGLIKEMSIIALEVEQLLLDLFIEIIHQLQEAQQVHLQLNQLQHQIVLTQGVPLQQAHLQVDHPLQDLLHQEVLPEEIKI